VLPDFLQTRILVYLCNKKMRYYNIYYVHIPDSSGYFIHHEAAVRRGREKKENPCVRFLAEAAGVRQSIAFPVAL
jgi:hypothetical protein